MGKVLIYALLEGFGGVEEYTMNLLRYSQEGPRRFGYVILGETCVYEQSLKDLGADYFYVPPKRKLIANISSFWKLLGKLKGEYDTVYFNTSGLYYPLPYLMALLRGYRIALHSHSKPIHDKREPVHRFNRWWIGKRCVARLACSSAAAEWMFGKKKEEAVFVPNGVQLDRFAYDPEKAGRLRRDWKLEDCFVVGHVGRLTGVKNQARLLDILACLKTLRPNSRLLLVGDGEDAQMLRQRALELGLQEDVVFYGSTNRPEEPILAMDCFVLPSLSEGFPVTLVEAQAAGLRCVAADTVTRQADLTGHVSYLSLEEPDAEWAREICALEPGRYDSRDMLKQKGFDARDLSDRVWALLHEGV